MALRTISIACIYDVVDGLFECELAVENNPTNLVSFTIGIGCVPMFNCVSACCVCSVFMKEHAYTFCSGDFYPPVICPLI